MAINITKTRLKEIINEEAKRLIKEEYTPSSFSGHAVGEAGVMVANKNLSDFISYVENTPGVYQSLPPVLIQLYKDAKGYFEHYPHLDNNQKPMEEGVVDKFTPYTPEEREQNFIPFTSKDTRTPFQKNPSYERALKAAQERRRQREMEKRNETKSSINRSDITKAITEVLSLYETGKLNEVMNYNASRVASDNNYCNSWKAEHVEPALTAADNAMKNFDGHNIQDITGSYQHLISLYNCHTLKVDSRLIDAKEDIKNKLDELVSFIRTKMSKNESRAVKSIIREWSNSNKLNEDSYSYNGLDQQAQYRKMGEDLMAQQNKEKYYKKNIMLFKRAYNKIYKEYSIIGQLKRKNPNAKEIFSGESFMNYVKEVEGNTLYNPIWEKYGGEYEEVADQFLQANVIKLRKEMGI